MYYRDHYPATDETRPGMRDAYTKTREFYTKIFGIPEEKFWPSAIGSTCGDSYSGFIPTKDE